MIKSFADSATEDIWHGNDTKAARKRMPPELWKQARKKLEQVNAAANFGDLKVPPSNRLHPLKGDREGQWGIRISDRYRVSFRWVENNAYEVEVGDYH